MLTNFASSNALICVLLFFMTFLHEDVALVTGAVFSIDGRISLSWAFASILAGVVASDMAIYGLGVLARRLARMRRMFISTTVTNMQSRLHGNLFATVSVCRLVPGILFPTFVACGWFGVPARKFLMASVISGTVYVSIVFPLVVTVGATALKKLGNWGWVTFLALLFSWILYKIVRAARSSSTKPATDLGGEDERAGIFPAPDTHWGMPSLASMRRTIAPAERIPPLLFYVPLTLRWLALSVRFRSLTLPTAANPHIEAGGLWGESKSNLMNQVSPELGKWIADFVTVRKDSFGASLNGELDAALAALAEREILFPLVAKPDKGWQGYGVRVLADAESLRNYFMSFPTGETVILQKKIPYEAEAGVFYIRMPGEDKGRVTSLTLRYHPHVIGDGQSTLAELIEASPRMRFKSGWHLGSKRDHMRIDAEKLSSIPGPGELVRLSFIGSLRVGGLYRDGKAYITPELSSRFDEIGRSMPDFHMGRFDIRFRSVKHLQRGEDFAIFEINGAGSEPIHMWDPEMSLGSAYRELCLYQSLLFDIADRNRKRGFAPTGIREFYRLTADYSRTLKAYPPSE